jgi:hypothetical protein
MARDISKRVKVRRPKKTAAYVGASVAAGSALIARHRAVMPSAPQCQVCKAKCSKSAPAAIANGARGRGEDRPPQPGRRIGAVALPVHVKAIVNVEGLSGGCGCTKWALRHVVRPSPSTGLGGGIDWLLFYHHRRLRPTLGYPGLIAFAKKRLADKDLTKKQGSLQSQTPGPSRGYRLQHQTLLAPANRLTILAIPGTVHDLGASSSLNRRISKRNDPACLQHPVRRFRLFRPPKATPAHRSRFT